MLISNPPTDPTGDDAYPVDKVVGACIRPLPPFSAKVKTAYSHFLSSRMAYYMIKGRENFMYFVKKKQRGMSGKHTLTVKCITSVN